MSSRRMEGGTAVAPVEGAREEALRKLLRRPERLLAIGWDPEELAGAAGELVTADDAGEATGAPYPAVVWAPGKPPAAEAVRGVRALLEDRGRLLLRVSPGAEEPGRRTIRALVRTLSETGFTILQEPPPEAVGGPAVLARRDEFLVLPLREEDAGAVRELFAECFPHDRRDPDHWRWKYDENPWTGRHASLVFAPGGELAVHYAGYGVPLWREGSDLLALQIGDTMTGERYRSVGRGTSSLLARAVRHFFAVHRGGPFELYYGFNTGPIQRFCRWFIGGTRVEPVAYRRAEIGAGPSRGGRAGGRYRIERVERVGRGWDRLFRRAAPRYRFLVRRRARWVDWRYLRRPDARYVVLAARRWRRLVGWAVFRRRGESLLWGDALVDPRHAGAAGALLAAALEQPEAAGVTSVEAWFPERPGWWSAELDRLGLARSTHPQELGLMVLPDRGSVPLLEELYYTMGDGDLV